MVGGAVLFSFPPPRPCAVRQIQWKWRPPRRRLLPTTHQLLLFDVPPVWQSSPGSREHFVFQRSLISAPKYSTRNPPLSRSSCCCQEEFCFTVSVLASWTQNMLFPLTSVSGTFHLVPALFLNMVDKAVIFPEALSPLPAHYRASFQVYVTTLQVALIP